MIFSNNQTSPANYFL